MCELIFRAASMAENWHKGQVRKYTNQPYITHPIRVAFAVMKSEIASQDTVAAAYLHDVVEDCGVSTETIAYRFNYKIASLVAELTNTAKVDIPNASRKERKAYDLNRIKIYSSREAKVIKMFDRIDNLGEYPLDNSEATKFLKQVYLDESFQLYHVLKDADELLAARLLDKIDSVSRQIGGLRYECCNY